MSHEAELKEASIIQKEIICGTSIQPTSEY
jgi:hypothetical protein